MLSLLAALALTSGTASGLSDSQLPAAPWWERITVSLGAGGESQGCLYTSSDGQRSTDCKIDAADADSSEHSTSRDGVTRVTFERRFTPGGTQAAATQLEAGDTLLGREVLALAIDGRGSVQTCKLVASDGEMMVDYGCKDAQAEHFQASAKSGGGAQREGTMTVLIYAHQEHVA